MTPEEYRDYLCDLLAADRQGKYDGVTSEQHMDRLVAYMTPLLEKP